MEADLTQCLVARKGEVITCPACGERLAEFRIETTAADWIRKWPSGRAAARALLVPLSHGHFKAVGRGLHLLCRCGGDPTGAAKRRGPLADCIGPRLHIDGHWRSLGGE